MSDAKKADKQPSSPPAKSASASQDFLIRYNDYMDGKISYRELHDLPRDKQKSPSPSETKK